MASLYTHAAAPHGAAEPRLSVAACLKFPRCGASLCLSRPFHPAAILPTSRSKVVSALIARAAATETVSVGAFESLLRWCIEEQGLPPTSLEPALVDSDIDFSQVPGFVSNKEVAKGEVLLEIPGDLGITSVDVGADTVLAPLAEGRSELVGLALFLMRQKSLGSASPWTPLLATLPAATATPILWDDALRAELLRGSPVLPEARSREAALKAEWAAITEVVTAQADASLYPASVFSERSFMEAMSVVLSHAAYLPSAQCFALLPLVGGIPRTGSAAGATLDYDLDREAVTLVATRPYSPGQEVRLYDGRPTGEVLLATGTLEPSNPADCMVMPASLVAADRLYAMKRQVLEDVGFGVEAEFPVFEDRLAIQHLAYLRLARLTDVAQFAKVSFEQDVIISPENEYEVLQLLMADLRDRNQGYFSEMDDDIKDLQRRDLTREQRLAAHLRMGEKRTIRGVMDGVRRRLAPIRGIPTKSGTLQDPNADFKEMFDVIESIPSAPKKLFDGLAAWARGESDPDWKKR